LDDDSDGGRERKHLHKVGYTRCNLHPQTAQPLDQQRDKVKDQVADYYATQTHMGAMQKQVNDVKNFLSQFFHVNTKSENDAKNRSGHLQELIQDQNVQLAQIQNTLPHVQIIITSLFAAIAV
jgi:hypothetical protein